MQAASSPKNGDRIKVKKKVLALSEADQSVLAEIVKKGQDWRMRHRAQTLLYFSEGRAAKDIATQQDLHLDAVYDRRKHWLKDGFASLSDKQRSRAPPTVNEHVGKPLVVILDNASVHKAKATQSMLKLLQQRGLKLYFLPPYSPGLNRIEKLWHKMKYEWMAYKAREAHTLVTDEEEILTGLGKTYLFDFCR